MQTSYSIDMAVGRVGAIADSALVQDIETRIAKQGPVMFGCVVTKGDATDTIVHPDAAAEVTDEKLVRGVVVASHEHESNPEVASPQYDQYTAVPVMRKGRIFVKAEDVISEGTSTVNVRYASGVGGTQLGGLRGAAVASETAVLPKSKWKSSTSSAGQLAVLELDL